MLYRKWTLEQLFSYDQYKTIEKTAYFPVVYIANPFDPIHVDRLIKGHDREGWKIQVTCHHYQTIERLRLYLTTNPMALNLMIAAIEVDVSHLYIMLDTAHYVSRSMRVYMPWCKRIWTLVTRAHRMAVTGVYYSVLGGAFCSLGKNNKDYAYKASILAIEQIKLAKKLKDPILECKCWLYFAEDLIQLGQLDKAEKMISHQQSFILSMQDTTHVGSCVK
ncbi:uncharacterized protein B0P05DRAFT_588156 [Gilbertella persicaria]|uniref:uncharacterized protein n=1 Tax=Gilbertella persicaria TaxID=101096 RepID=UPI00221EE202|nr:uncharacterized protein B0P05DRAFT_588156 [Gilbertella persicaria]KAI8076505.1 hypothetical protein B0P05DRAFT_588156 [Gilbertella persicaria]